jgi:hypothetical protein
VYTATQRSLPLDLVLPLVVAELAVVTALVLSLVGLLVPGGRAGMYCGDANETALLPEYDKEIGPPRNVSATMDKVHFNTAVLTWKAPAEANSEVGFSRRRLCGTGWWGWPASKGPGQGTVALRCGRMGAAFNAASDRRLWFLRQCPRIGHAPPPHVFPPLACVCICEVVWAEGSGVSGRGQRLGGYSLNLRTLLPFLASPLWARGGAGGSLARPFPVPMWAPASSHHPRLDCNRPSFFASVWEGWEGRGGRWKGGQQWVVPRERGLELLLSDQQRLFRGFRDRGGLLLF